ncbi:hypothetical protein SH449x_004243 [Pirellulaceae bacterium SH449]
MTTTDNQTNPYAASTTDMSDGTDVWTRKSLPISLIYGWATFFVLCFLSLRAVQKFRDSSPYEQFAGQWGSLRTLVPLIIITLVLAFFSLRNKDSSRTARILSWALVFGTVVLCAALGKEWFL